jgi:hypothetical protein
MRVGPGVARSLFVAGTILVAVHVALLAFDPHALLLSNLLILRFDLLGLTVCLLGASSESPETGPLWLLFGCGLLLVVVVSLDGRITTSRSRYTLRPRPTTPTSSFLRTEFLYCLAICSRSTDAGLKSFAWLDGAQALIAAMLAYLQLFSVLPSHAHPEAISATNLMYLNNAENWVLVGAVTLRFFSNPSPARRRFYRVLSVYLWVNGIVLLILGYLELKRGWPEGLQDVAWGPLTWLS